MGCKKVYNKEYRFKCYRSWLKWEIIKYDFFIKICILLLGDKMVLWFYFKYFEGRLDILCIKGYRYR